MGDVAIDARDISRINRRALSARPKTRPVVIQARLLREVLAHTKRVALSPRRFEATTVSRAPCRRRVGVYGVRPTTTHSSAVIARPDVYLLKTRRIIE